MKAMVLNALCDLRENKKPLEFIDMPSFRFEGRETSSDCVFLPNRPHELVLRGPGHRLHSGPDTSPPRFLLSLERWHQHVPCAYLAESCVLLYMLPRALSYSLSGIW